MFDDDDERRTVFDYLLVMIWICIALLAACGTAKLLVMMMVGD